MTEKQILKKAIKKAEKNGYRLGELGKNWYFNHIFSHDFAKAFWGENHPVKFEEGETFGIKDFHEVTEKPWQYHLQQMVLKEEPLKYLEKFL